MHHVSGMKPKIEITINLITYFFTARLTGASVRVWFYSSLRCTEVYVTRIVETWDWRGDSDTGLVSDEFKTHLE